MTKKKDTIPRREPSVVIPPKERIYITADKTTCVCCPCFPKEDPWVPNKKLNRCQVSPLTLYELASIVVDTLPYPDAFDWSTDDVCNWMCDEMKLPQYIDCIRDNYINGRSLLLLEYPYAFPKINIVNYEHIKTIIEGIRKLYSTELLRFLRSIGLPIRYPLTHCTIFKSRTGPTWGIRQNWQRSDILRWMKILNPKPIKLNHWELVWYQRPDYPTTKFARIPKAKMESLPRYVETIDICYEYLTPRKFRVMTDLKEEDQYIWMERRPEPYEEPPVKKVKSKPKKEKPKPVDMSLLKGRELVLARRLRPKPKFFL